MDYGRQILNLKGAGSSPVGGTSYSRPLARATWPMRTGSRNPASNQASVCRGSTPRADRPSLHGIHFAYFCFTSPDERAWARIPAMRSRSTTPSRLEWLNFRRRASEVPAGYREAHTWPLCVLAYSIPDFHSGGAGSIPVGATDASIKWRNLGPAVHWSARMA